LNEVPYPEKACKTHGPICRKRHKNSGNVVKKYNKRSQGIQQEAVMETQIIDLLFLELSQFSQATTARELKYEKELQAKDAIIEVLEGALKDISESKVKPMRGERIWSTTNMVSFTRDAVRAKDALAKAKAMREEK